MAEAETKQKSIGNAIPILNVITIGMKIKIGNTLAFESKLIQATITNVKSIQV